MVSDEGHDPYVKLFDNNEREFTQSIIRIHELVKGSGKPNYEGLRIPVYSGINYEFLSQELEGYDYIGVVQLMRYGAPINHVSGAAQIIEVTVRQDYSQMRLIGTLQRSGDINQY